MALGVKTLVFFRHGDHPACGERTFNHKVDIKTRKRMNQENTFNPIDQTVFPSTEKTIFVANDQYGGAHHYKIINCLGFNPVSQNTEYAVDKDMDYEKSQTIDFVFKDEDGNFVPGLQSEQLVIMLIDRHKKLNEKFPSRHNQQAIAGLQMFLDACEARVRERMSRGVMGKLEK